MRVHNIRATHDAR